MTGEYDAGYENCIDSMVRQMEDMQFRIDSLHRENAKLRELVQSFHSAMLCTLDTGMWPTDPKWLEQRMRELGVDA